MKKLLNLSLLVILATTFSFTVPSTGGYQIGDKAEDFSLKNTDGKMVSLKNYSQAKGYIVVFTCNSCPYAQAYEQRIIELHKKLEPQGYPIVAINPNDPAIASADSYDKMQERAKNQNYPFAYLMDEKQEVFPKFGATRTPHVFVLDKDLIVKYIGGIDDNPDDSQGVTINYVENAIESIKAGKSPDPSLTKAIGCSIKKKKK
ncbi:MAG: thioredoxin family protein [Saprospiraceae bacterium]|nr:thioredoxin family protein [Saprospiraceae bacterium]